MKSRIVLIIMIVLSLQVSAKKIKEEVPVRVQYGVENTGTKLEISFEKGEAYNHPLFAIWLADANGNYIQTLYVSQSIGKGVFLRGSRKTGQWMPGEIQRPAALPYWVHQRNVTNENGGLLPTSKSPVVDAYTGATPKNSFVLEVQTEEKLQGKYIKDNYGREVFRAQATIKPDNSKDFTSEQIHGIPATLDTLKLRGLI